MRAGGVAAEINALGITAEARRVFVNPRHGTAHLIDHGAQAVGGFFHADEIRHNKMHAGFDKQLGGEGIAFGSAAMPCAAVDEYKYRRVRLVCFIDVDFFDLGGAVRQAQWFADALTHRIAFQHKPLAYIAGAGCVGGLVVGGVECGLIVVHENVRAGGLYGQREGGHCKCLFLNN